MIKQIKLNEEESTLKTAKITSLSHDGRGIALIENKTTFVSGALPNEVVQYKLTKKHRSYNEAEVGFIEQPSNRRAAPPCQHFGLCGGCSLQHMDMAMQLEVKEKTLIEQLTHFGRVTPRHILAPITAETVGYRRKARLGVKFVIKKNKLLVGFREKGSHYLAELNACETLHPAIGKKFKILKELIRSLTIYQHIPQLEVAIGDEEIALVVRHLAPLAEEDLDKFISFGMQESVQLYLQPNPPEKIHQIYPKHSQPALRYTLPAYQLEFLFHPLDFTQINLSVNRLMVQQAIQLLELNKEETVLDLFCGIGNFTLPIAKHAAYVTGIEGEADMVIRAQKNAEHNHISNVNYYASNLAQLKTDEPWMNKHYDKILIDPPRAGAKALLPLFEKFKAKRILYVSCNPATLARDAGELVHHHHYELTHAGIMNMFPHTAHIEAMALFERCDSKH